MCTSSDYQSLNLGFCVVARNLNFFWLYKCHILSFNHLSGDAMRLKSYCMKFEGFLKPHIQSDIGDTYLFNELHERNK